MDLMIPVFLRDGLPDFSSELELKLREMGESDLANQIDGLKIVDRCSLGTEDCATFYTQPPPDGAWGEGHQNIRIGSVPYWLVLDVVNGKICCVDIQDRPDLREQLDLIFQ